MVAHFWPDVQGTSGCPLSTSVSQTQWEKTLFSQYQLQTQQKKKKTKQVKESTQRQKAPGPNWVFKERKEKQEAPSQRELRPWSSGETQKNGPQNIQGLRVGYTRTKIIRTEHTHTMDTLVPWTHSGVRWSSAWGWSLITVKTIWT